jgi:hypothetical protein
VQTGGKPRSGAIPEDFHRVLGEPTAEPEKPQLSRA